MAQRTCTITACERRHRARGYCSTHYNRLVVGEDKRHPIRTVRCVMCGADVVRRVDSTYQPTCSVGCRAALQFGASLAPVSSYTWRTDAVSRARKQGCLVIEPYARESVFERDGWACQACEAQCHEPNPFDPAAATVDHVVPLSLGGEHTLANAQTLCLSCNSAKQDDPYVTCDIGGGGGPSKSAD